MAKRKEYIKGGYADKIPDKKFNKRALNMGIKVEMEHTTNRKIAKEIAKDHLYEFPRYYTALRKMENKLKKTKRKYPRRYK